MSLYHVGLIIYISLEEMIGIYALEERKNRLMDRDEILNRGRKEDRLYGEATGRNQFENLYRIADSFPSREISRLFHLYIIN